MPHADPDARRAYARQWYAKNKDLVKRRSNARYHYDPVKVKEYRWKHYYGLEPDVARAILDGPCALCDRQAQVIDHDHASGRVRGGLCVSHNTALGHLGDTPEALQRALEYVSCAQ